MPDYKARVFAIRGEQEIELTSEKRQFQATHDTPDLATYYLLKYMPDDEILRLEVTDQSTQEITPYNGTTETIRNTIRATQ